MSADATCAICSRTILAGERTHGYVEGREQRTVCELCIARAERHGWRHVDEVEPERDQEGHEGRGRLSGLLHRRGRRPGAPATPIPVPQADPAAPGRRARSAPPVDTSAPTPFERAVARFNSSEAGRTVVGLTRTLGMPSVSIGASAGGPEEVRITVAWELSWYQWGVDIGDELRPVFQIDKGREIDQLDHVAQQWNASVDEGGKLSLRAPGQRPSAQPAAPNR